MKKFFTIASIASLVLSVSACSSQQIIEGKQLILQTSEPDIAKDLVNQFLKAIQENKIDQVKKQTCLQSNDLTKYAPLGIKSWKVQEVAEGIAELDDAKSFTALTVIESETKTEPFRVKVWKSDVFFGDHRQGMEDVRKLQIEFNRISESVGREGKPLSEIPGRQDVSMEPYCVEFIVPKDSFRK